MTLSRKEFLAKGVFSLGQLFFGGVGRAGSEPAGAVRPPRFREEAAAVCRGCTACRDACPSGIIAVDEGREGPRLDFAAGRCTFCFICAGACPGGVLTFPEEGERAFVGTAVVEHDHCLVRGGCFTCAERCSEGAITHLFGSGLRVSAAKCNGCGACEHACPVEPKAIHVVPLHS